MRASWQFARYAYFDQSFRIPLIVRNPGGGAEWSEKCGADDRLRTGRLIAARAVTSGIDYSSYA
jgi:hypothetical protein